jgi:putative endonuclease
MIQVHQYYVYILTNAYNTVLYTGITNDLERRCLEHKKKYVKGFTQKYNVDKLVNFETYTEVEEAIRREKQIKGYSRSKKIALIEGLNKDWRDLFLNGKIHLPRTPK